ncbi:cholesterol 25-hydroxylase-like protein [Lampris incognitus]|uniref:cholesterol 25-hydroxylase-like protein n=1 Tax=Lampris incognitus TaxID=2546036 RepID=UPI0024B5BD28|nr:cholesterol 25-hydroxylase-like protein [Lampris incognitus]
MILQPVWDYVLGYSHLLRSPFFPVIFSLSVYLLFCLPFVVLDLLSPRVALIRRYKIQPESIVTWDVMKSCLALVLYNHLVYIFPVTVLHWYWRPVALPREAVGVLSLLWGLLACLLLFDFQSFVWHLLHHKVPWLYRTFHKVHHTHTATSALTTEHSGAWETLSLGVFAAINPFILGCHPLTEMAFFVLNIWLSVEDHCGYDLPWATHRLVPWGLYGGAPHHDLHHLKFKSNYAPYFTHWDYLAGTLLVHDD